MKKRTLLAIAAATTERIRRLRKLGKKYIGVGGSLLLAVALSFVAPGQVRAEVHTVNTWDQFQFRVAAVPGDFSDPIGANNSTSGNIADSGDSILLGNGIVFDTNLTAHRLVRTRDGSDTTTSSAYYLLQNLTIDGNTAKNTIDLNGKAFTFGDTGAGGTFDGVTYEASLYEGNNNLNLTNLVMNSAAGGTIEVVSSLKDDGPSAFLTLDGTTWYNTAIVGDTNVVLNGTNTFNGGLAGGLHTYAGTTTVNGTLNLGAAGALSDDSVLDFNGGTVNADGYDQTVDGLNGAGTYNLGDGDLTIKNAPAGAGFAPGNFFGTITGTGGVTLNNPNLVGTGVGQILSGKNEYTGLTTIGRFANLQIQGEDTIAASSGVDIGTNGYLSVYGTQTVQKVTGTGTVSMSTAAATLTIEDADFGGAVANTAAGTINLQNGTYSGVITDPGSVVDNTGATLASNINLGGDADSVVTLTGDNRGAGTVFNALGGTVVANTRGIGRGQIVHADTTYMSDGVDSLWAGSTAFNVTGTNTVTYSTANGDLQIGSQITGTGNVVVTGGGTVTFQGSTTTNPKTYTGTTTIDTDTELVLFNSVDTIASSSAVNIKGTVSSASNQTLHNISGTGTIVGDGNRYTLDGNFAGKITGTTGVTVAAGEELTLSGTADYTNSTVVDGTLNAGAANAFSANSVHAVNGPDGLIDLNDKNQTVKGIMGDGTVELGTGELKVDNQGDATLTTGQKTFSGVIKGDGDLTLAGNGTELALENENEYTGTTTVGTGTTLRLTADNAIDSSTKIVANGTILATDKEHVFQNLTGNGLVQNAIGGSLTVEDADYAGDLNVSGEVFLQNGVYSGTLTDANPGNGNSINIGGVDGSTVTLTGDNVNTATDGTTFNALGGTVIANETGLGINQIVQGDTTYQSNGGDMTWSNAFAINNGVTATLDSSKGNITIDENIALNTALTGIISGDGNLVADGGKTVTLNTENTYTGATSVVNDTTLVLGTDGAIDTSSGVTLGNGSTLENQNNLTQTLQSLSGDGNVHNIGTGSVLNILDTVDVTDPINGDNVLHANVLNDGQLTIAKGIYDGTISGEGSATFGTNAFDVVSDPAEPTDYTGGQVTIGAAQKYTGATTIGEYGVKLTANDVFKTSSGVAVGGNVDMTDTDQYFGNVSGGTVEGDPTTLTDIALGAEGKLTIDSGNYAGTVSGNGDFIKGTTGDLTLGARNAEFTGSAYANGGTLTLDAANAFDNATGGMTIAKGATVQDNSGYLDESNPINPVNVAGAQEFQKLNGAGDLVATDTFGTDFTIGDGVFGGSIKDNNGGAASVTVNGNFTLNAEGKQEYTGNTTVNGTLNAGATNAFSANSIHVVDGTMNLDGYDQTIKALRSTDDVDTGVVKLDDATLTVDGGYGYFSGIIKGEGNFTVAKNATQYLSGANEYTGKTDVQGNLFLEGNDTVKSSGLVNVDGMLTSNTGNQTIQKLTGEGLVTDSDLVRADGASVLTVQDANFEGDMLIAQTANLQGGTYSGDLNGAERFDYGWPDPVSVGYGEFNLSGKLTLTGDNFTETQTIVNATGGTIAAGTGSLGVDGGNVNVTGDTVFTGVDGNKVEYANDFTIGNGENNSVIATFDSSKGAIDLNGKLKDVVDDTNPDDPVILSAGNVAVTGTGTVTTNAENSYTGATSVNGGTFVVGADGSIATSESVFIKDGAALVSKGGIFEAEKQYNSVHGEGTFHNEGSAMINNGSTVVDTAGNVFDTDVEKKNTFDGNIKNHGNVLTLNGGIYNGVISENGALHIGNVTRVPEHPDDFAGVVQLNNVNTYTGETRLGADGLLFLTVDNAIAESKEVWTGDDSATSNSQIYMSNTAQTFKRMTGYGDVFLGNSGVLTVNTGDYHGTVFGNGDFVKEGAGNMIFHEQQTYTGTTTLNGGVTLYNAEDAIAASSNVIVGKDATLMDGAGQQTFQQLNGSGTVVGQAGGQTEFIISGNLGEGGTFNGSIINGAVDEGVRGVTSLTIDENVVFHLGGEKLNTYSGKTTIKNGATLVADTDSAFSKNSTHNVNGSMILDGYTVTIGALEGNGGVYLGNGRLITQGNATLVDGATPAETVYSGTITGSKTSEFVVNGATALTLSRDVAGDQFYGKVLVDNNGTMNLGGVDVFAKAKEIEIDGVVNVIAEQQFQYVTGFGDVNANADIVIYDALNSVDFTLADEVQMVVYKGLYDGVISGDGKLVKAGNGTVTLNGDNTYTGGTDAWGGTIVAGSDTAFGTSDINIYSSTTLASGENLFENKVTVENDIFVPAILAENNTPQTVTFDTTNGQWIQNGVIRGSGNVAKVGTGTLTLGTTNEYTGKTLVDEGRLTFSAGNHNAIATSSELRVGVKGIIDLNNTSQEIQSGLIAGHLVGDGSLVKTSPGTLEITNENTEFDGIAFVQDGTLSINNGLALGGKSTNTVVVEGGNFEMTESMKLNNNVWVNNDENNAITVADGKTAHLKGELADLVDGGTFTKLGEGTLIVDNASNTGATNIHHGTVQGGQTNALSANSIYDLDFNGTLSTGGYNQKVAMVVGQPGSTLELDNATLTVGDVSGYKGVDKTNDLGEYVYAGTITGNSVYLPNGQYSGIDKVGQSTWVLTGKNTYAGQTQLTDGVIKITEDANLGDGGQIVLNGGLLHINGTFETDRNVVVTNRTWNDGSPTTVPNGVRIEDGQIVTITGIISDYEGDNGIGDFNKWGNGKLVVLGKNTNNYTNVEQGTLEGNSDSLQGYISIQNDAFLVFNQDFDGTFNYRDGEFITGGLSSIDWSGLPGTGGTIEKIGTGTLNIITDNSAFLGETYVKDGELRVAKMYTLGTCPENIVAGNGKHDVISAGFLGGDVIVAPVDGSGATPILSGNGTIGRNVTVKSNGILAPKNLTSDWVWTNWDTNQFLADGETPNPNFANKSELALNINGDLTFEKTVYERCVNLNENAGTFMVTIAHNTNKLGKNRVGVNDYVYMNGGNVTIDSGSLDTGFGTQLVVNTFSDRCDFNFAFANNVTYTIIDNAGSISGDFQKLYSGELANVYSKNIDWDYYRGLLDEEGKETVESKAYRQRFELLDIAGIGTEYVPRFLGFRGEVNTNEDGSKRYDLVLGKSNWDFHTPVEGVPVSGTDKPFKAGSHNQSEVGNALNCVLTQISNRYDSVTGQWNTFNPVTGEWSNVHAYQDSLWNAALCNMGDPSITVEQYREAYNQLAGDVRANSIYMGLVSHYRNAYNHITFDRYSGGPCSGCGDLECDDDVSCTPHCGTHTKRRDVWFEGTFDALRFKSDGNSQGFDMDSGGFMAGLGRKICRNGRIGLMVGYSHPELKSRYGKIKANDFTIGLYGGARVHTSHRCIRTIDFLGYVGAGFQDYDSNRWITSDILVDSKTNLKSSYEGNSIEAVGEIALPWEIVRNRFMLRPFIGLDYRRAYQEGATESGHDIFALRYSSQDMDQLFIRLGIGAELNPCRNLAFRTRFGWDYQLLDEDRPEQTTRFVGAGYNTCKMNIWGLKQGDSRFTAAVNAQWYLNSCKTLSLLGDYEVNAMDRGNAHQASLGLIWNF